MKLYTCFFITALSDEHFVKINEENNLTENGKLLDHDKLDVSRKYNGGNHENARGGSGLEDDEFLIPFFGENNATLHGLVSNPNDASLLQDTEGGDNFKLTDEEVKVM